MLCAGYKHKKYNRHDSKKKIIKIVVGRKLCKKTRLELDKDQYATGIKTKTKILIEYGGMK